MTTRTAKRFDLIDAFFPVKEMPISVDGTSRPIAIPGYKAIVESETKRPLSVVSNKYRLVTNKEAYELADYVVRAIFEGKTLDDFECFNILMPKTKGSCRIDLIIPNNYKELFGQGFERWLPFVRISNSYNRTLVLKYEIGFCRYICMSGVIWGQTGITFSITHLGSITQKEIDALINRTKKDIGDIEAIWKGFEEKMDYLRRTPLPSSSALAIFCKAFDISVNAKEVTAIQKEGLAKRAKQIVTASKDYFKELGNNAYAMMNVLSDYASFPEWTNGSTNYVDGYQRKVGKWIDEFIEESRKEDFNLSKYLGDTYQSTAYYLESLLPEE